MSNSALSPDQIILTESNLIDGKGCFICVGISEVKEYDKEKKTYTDKRIGTRVEVVIPQRRYARLYVQIPIGFDDLLVPDAKIRFEGLEARFYRDFSSGEYNLSAKATGITVLKQ